MSSLATAYLAEIDLEETRSAAVSPEPASTSPHKSTSIDRRDSENDEIVSQSSNNYLEIDEKGRGLYFATLAHHYSMLFSLMERDVNLLNDAGKVTYLIDEDVIRNVVEARYDDPRLQVQAEKLLTSDNIRYTMPLGAFQELITWLSTLMPHGLTIWSEGSVQLDDCVKNVRDLAIRCNVDPSGSTLEVTARIASVLEADKVRVERLLEVLRRCEPVAADYDVEDVARIKNLIVRIPRLARRTDGKHKGKDKAKRNAELRRDKKDERDAINLSIAFKRLRESKRSGHEKETFVLITETDALKNLVEHVRHLGFEFIQELADLLLLPAPEVTEGMCPVLNPERAFIVEEFRNANGFGDDAMEQLRNLQLAYKQLGNVLRGAAHTPNRKEKALVSSGDIEREIREKLDRLKMVYDNDTFYRRLEQSRATEVSIQYLKEKYKPGSVAPNQKSENLRLTIESLLKVVRHAYEEIEDVGVTSYRSECSTDESGAFDSVTVYSEYPTEQVLEGEVYRASPHSIEKTDRAYSLRWPTSCTDRQFLAAIGDIVRLSERNGSSDASTKLIPISSFEPVRSGGIVLFTNGGAYGIAFEDLPLGLRLGRLDLHGLLKVARSQGGSKLVIEAIRVCAPFGDFQLDISGNESGGREVFVISQYNIAPQIVHLCSLTSLLVILPLRLNALLSESVTAKFPVYKNVSRA